MGVTGKKEAHGGDVRTQSTYASKGSTKRREDKSCSDLNNRSWCSKLVSCEVIFETGTDRPTSRAVHRTLFTG